ncbi:MAG: hypothetical protein U9Q07_13525 [Planctomycetota bacterium]|nr:hypothetical protein [Planctomycetota bacterium]
MEKQEKRPEGKKSDKQVKPLSFIKVRSVKVGINSGITGGGDQCC